MKWVGYVEVRVGRITLPGDIGTRMKAPHVVALASSTDDLGGEPMNAPTVNADGGGYDLVAGRDRMAATLLRKRKKVWVHVGVDWTPEDLLKAEIHENLHRRHDDKAALTKALVDRAEALVVSGRATGKAADPKPGRPETTRGEARRIVAEASGEATDAVRSNDRRAAAKERDEAGTGSGDTALAAPSPPPIDCYGHVIDAKLFAMAAAIVEPFKKLDALLKQAQAVITAMEWDHAQQQRLGQMVHDAAASARGVRPTHLCPYCKGATAGKACQPCKGLGVVARAVFESAPGEMRATNGVHRDVKPAKPKREMQVNGKPLSQAWAEEIKDEDIPF